MLTTAPHWSQLCYTNAVIAVVVPSSALALLVGWQEGHLAHNLGHLSPKGRNQGRAS